MDLHHTAWSSRLSRLTGRNFLAHQRCALVLFAGLAAAGLAPAAHAQTDASAHTQLTSESQPSEVQSSVVQPSVIQPSVIQQGRPMIARSSASIYAAALPDPAKSDVSTVLAGLAQSQLDFFDDLERQPLVCHEDALHAALLLGAGINAADYSQRLDMAQRLGWIASGFDRPALEATTIGEVCRIMCRILQPASGQAQVIDITQEQALRRIASLGGLPEDLKIYQGITGAQYLSVLGVVHDSVSGLRAAVQTTPSADADHTASPLQRSASIAEPVDATSNTSSMSMTQAAQVQPQPASAVTDEIADAVSKGIRSLSESSTQVLLDRAAQAISSPPSNPAADLSRSAVSETSSPIQSNQAAPNAQPADAVSITPASSADSNEPPKSKGVTTQFRRGKPLRRPAGH